jgi:hypothetical protein
MESCSPWVKHIDDTTGETYYYSDPNNGGNGETTWTTPSSFSSFILPSHWVEHKDDDTGDIYYYSDPSLGGTGEATWERPFTVNDEAETGATTTTPAMATTTNIDSSIIHHSTQPSTKPSSHVVLYPGLKGTKSGEGRKFSLVIQENYSFLGSDEKYGPLSNVKEVTPDACEDGFGFGSEEDTTEEEDDDDDDDNGQFNESLSSVTTNSSLPPRSGDRKSFKSMLTDIENHHGNQMKVMESSSSSTSSMKTEANKRIVEEEWSNDYEDGIDPMFVVNVLNKKNKKINLATIRIQSSIKKVIIHLYDLSTPNHIMQQLVRQHTTRNEKVDGGDEIQNNIIQSTGKRIYRIESIDKIERSCNATSVKLQLNDNTSINILFINQNQLETFNELIHIINEDVWILDEGEWVDECNENVVCYAIQYNKNKIGSSPTPRIICINIKSGHLYIVQPSVYYGYSGKIGKKKSLSSASTSGHSSTNSTVATNRGGDRSAPIEAKGAIGLDLMMKEVPRSFSTYLLYCLDTRLQYTLNKSLKTMTITIEEEQNNTLASKTETLVFASITCLQRCSGYISPFTLGFSMQTIQSKGFKQVSKYGNNLEIYATTWNVGETKPMKEKDYYLNYLRPRDDDKKRLPIPDLVVIGLQECSKKYKTNWCKTIHTTLNDSLLASANHHARKDRYVLLSNLSMVQIHLYVFVLHSISSRISDIKTETVPTGIGGMYGNKGAIGIGFQYRHGTRFCFICSHLAARVQRISHRASDYREITSRMKGLRVWNGGSNSGGIGGTSASAGGGTGGRSSIISTTSSTTTIDTGTSTGNNNGTNTSNRRSESITRNSSFSMVNSIDTTASTSRDNTVSGSLTSPLDSYDHIFWLGDVNYRVHMSEGPGCDTPDEYNIVQNLIDNENFSELILNDQLTKEMKLQRVFCGYKESKIQFPPTYRMVKGKDGYSNKRNQSASYTDRILYKSINEKKSSNIKVRKYSSDHTMKQSDHRPVYLQCNVKTVLPYINLISPSHFMGGTGTCEIVPTNIKIVMDEIDIVVHNMNNIFDSMSDVIDPNPKKTKNPIKKIFSKLFKKRKKKKKNEDGDSLDNDNDEIALTKHGKKTKSKRVKSKRKNTETRSRGSSVTTKQSGRKSIMGNDGFSNLGRTRSLSNVNKSKMGGGWHSSSSKKNEEDDDSNSGDSDDYTIGGSNGGRHNRSRSQSPPTSPHFNLTGNITRDYNSRRSEPPKMKSDSSFLKSSYTPTKLQLHFWCPSLNLNGNSMEIIPSNEPLRGVIGTLDTMKGQWNDIQLPILVRIYVLCHIFDTFLITSFSSFLSLPIVGTNNWQSILRQASTINNINYAKCTTS